MDVRNRVQNSFRGDGQAFWPLHHHLQRIDTGKLTLEGGGYRCGLVQRRGDVAQAIVGFDPEVHHREHTSQHHAGHGQHPMPRQDPTPQPVAKSLKLRERTNPEPPSTPPLLWLAEERQAQQSSSSLQADRD